VLVLRLAFPAFKADTRLKKGLVRLATPLRLSVVPAWFTSATGLLMPRIGSHLPLGLNTHIIAQKTLLHN